MDDSKVNIKGHRSKVKITRLKNVISASIDSLSSLVTIAKGLSHQGSRSYGLRSKVTLLKVSLMLKIFGRWAHKNVKLLHLVMS